MSKVDDIERLFTETVRRFDTVDIIVVNAGREIIDQPILGATEDSSIACSP